MVEWGGRKRIEKLWKYYSWWSSVRQWYTGSVLHCVGISLGWQFSCPPAQHTWVLVNKAISSQTSPTCVLSHHGSSTNSTTALQIKKWRRCLVLEGLFPTALSSCTLRWCLWGEYDIIVYLSLTHDLYLCPVKYNQLPSYGFYSLRWFSKPFLVHPGNLRWNIKFSLLFVRLEGMSLDHIFIDVVPVRLALLGQVLY